MSFRELLSCLWVGAMSWHRVRVLLSLLGGINMYFAHSETSPPLSCHSWALASVWCRGPDSYVSRRLWCVNLPSSIFPPCRPRKNDSFPQFAIWSFPWVYLFQTLIIKLLLRFFSPLLKKSIIKSVLLPLESFSKYFPSYIWSSFQFIANLLCFMGFFVFLIWANFPWLKTNFLSPCSCFFLAMNLDRWGFCLLAHLFLEEFLVKKKFSCYSLPSLYTTIPWTSDKVFEKSLQTYFCFSLTSLPTWHLCLLVWKSVRRAQKEEL